MASIFLVNDNKIVSRLLQLSAQKHGYMLEEKSAPEPSRDHYDIVLIDSDKYTPEIVDELRSRITFNKIGYIGVKHEEVPPEFDLHLDKPFLPSDFVTLIEENAGASSAPETVPEEQQVLSEEVDLDEGTLSMTLEEPAQTETKEDLDIDALLAEGGEELQDLDELATLDELGDLEELDLNDLEAGAPAQNEPAPAPEVEESGLKDLDKTEDALRELDALDEELEDVDLSLDSSTVMSTGVAEKFVEEPKEPLSLYEKELEATHEEVPAVAEENETATVEEEEELNPLDNLEGSEDIEQEHDYIEEELTVDALAQEFDTLNEEEVLKALHPEAELPDTEEHSLVDTSATAAAAAATGIAGNAVASAVEEEIVQEEILHEEIAHEGTETMVESNDVEQWIRDAVAKAITPEMIQEALQNMEVTIKLDFKKRDT